jgi:hypothetical protein
VSVVQLSPARHCGVASALHAQAFHVKRCAVRGGAPARAIFRRQALAMRECRVPVCEVQPLPPRDCRAGSALHAQAFHLKRFAVSVAVRRTVETSEGQAIAERVRRVAVRAVQRTATTHGRAGSASTRSSVSRETLRGHCSRLPDRGVFRRASAAKRRGRVRVHVFKLAPATHGRAGSASTRSSVSREPLRGLCSGKPHRAVFQIASACQARRRVERNTSN